MRRRGWFALNAALAAACVAGAWLAVNSREFARPERASFERVSLPRETPPLPPAPFAEGPTRTLGGLAQRRIFAAEADAAARAPRHALPEISDPVFRGLAPAIAAPSEIDDRLQVDDRVALDDVRIGLRPDRPRHEQFFGGHLISPETFQSDLGGDPGEAEAPTYARRPRPNPRRTPDAERPEPDRPETETAVSEPPAAATRPERPAETAAAAPPPPPSRESEPLRADPPTTPQQPTIDRVAEAATSIAEAPQPTEDGLILLGVLEGRGSGRALVRTPQGERVRVRQGDEIEGWRVSTIGEDFVRLQRASQTRLLRMPRAAN